jgi:hypothetical protein
MGCKNKKKTEPEEKNNIPDLLKLNYTLKKIVVRIGL